MILRSWISDLQHFSTCMQPAPKGKSCPRRAAFRQSRESENLPVRAGIIVVALRAHRSSENRYPVGLAGIYNYRDTLVPCNCLLLLCPELSELLKAQNQAVSATVPDFMLGQGCVYFFGNCFCGTVEDRGGTGGNKAHAIQSFKSGTVITRIFPAAFLVVNVGTKSG